MMHETEIGLLFIDFKNIDINLIKLKGKYIIMLMQIINTYQPSIGLWSMKPKVFQWCRENHIKYRKVTIGNSIFNVKKQVIEYIGEKREGLLFYSPEDATAFTLRWL